MYYLYIFLVWWHIINVIIWVGASFFLVLVLMPVLRSEKFAHVKVELFSNIMMRLRLISWLSITSIIISGILLFLFRFGKASFSLAFWENLFATTFFWKLIGVGFVLVLSIFHDFYWGEQTLKAWQQEGDSEKVKKMRRHSSVLGRIIFVFALVIVFLAVKFVRGG